MTLQEAFEAAVLEGSMASPEERLLLAAVQMLLAPRMIVLPSHKEAVRSICTLVSHGWGEDDVPPAADDLMTAVLAAI